jgi:outer membrane protein TolC
MQGEEYVMKPRRLCCLAATTALAMVLGAAILGAQQATPSPSATIDFKSNRWFPNLAGPYFSPSVPEVRLSNSERIRTLMREGKLRLSVEEAIALALENNLDIAVARFGPAYAQTDILRTRSGGSGRGVQGAFQSSALFAGALGGGVSTGGGGGGSGAGGATGGGSAVNLGNAGSFDPVAGFSFGWDRRTTPLGTKAVTGVPYLTSQNTGYQGYFTQSFQTGTSYTLFLSGSRSTSTSLTSLFNPQVTSSFGVGINQPLLNGFGYRANAKFIRLAKNSATIADSVFRQQVITTVTQVLNLYYDLVYFRENVRVAERSLALAQKTLNDNQRQVEIGTLAPIEVVRAESEVAARTQDLIVAQTGFQQQQELIKTALSKQVDKELAAAEVDPTDSLPEPKPEDVPPLDDALSLAAQNRAEIEQADLNLRGQEITVKANRNGLLPSLNLFATYIGQGLSGNRCGQGLPVVLCIQNPLVNGQVIPDGSSQALTQTFQGQFPDYSFGINLSFPIRNRSAQADAARALLEERQLRTQMQKTKNQVAQEVRNAEIALTQAKAQIEAARKAVTLAQQTLDAEQKKFQLGESTVFLVIQAQRDLVAAEVRNVLARAVYAKALTQFAQATGTTLAKHNIQIGEAREGRVTRVPNIPGTAENRGADTATPGS